MTWNHKQDSFCCSYSTQKHKEMKRLFIVKFRIQLQQQQQHDSAFLLLLCLFVCLFNLSSYYLYHGLCSAFQKGEKKKENSKLHTLQIGCLTQWKRNKRKWYEKKRKKRFMEKNWPKQKRSYSPFQHSLAFEEKKKKAAKPFDVDAFSLFKKKKRKYTQWKII